MSTAMVAAAALMGAAVGLGSYTFIYARGYSYLTNDPAACANCHIMQDHFAAWTKASHRAVATCNDCHTPPGLLPKYTTKAINGFNHSFAFTTGRFPEPLRITPRNHDITEQACRTCHAELTASIEAAAAATHQTALVCTTCHNTVGHLE